MIIDGAHNSLFFNQRSQNQKRKGRKIKNKRKNLEKAKNQKNSWSSEKF